MKKYIIRKGGIFKTLAPNIIIYDSRGVEFYNSSTIPTFNGVFTIPYISIGGGALTCTAPIYKIGELVKYNIELKKPEHDFKHNWNDFVILFQNNPRKCSIFHNEKKIIFDTSYIYKPYYELCFILYHEQGHNYYDTEVYADEYSIKKMLNKGFTPYQIFNSIMTLNENNDYRKVACINFLKQIIK